MANIVLETIIFQPGEKESAGARTMTITLKGQKDGKAFEDVWIGLPYAAIKEAMAYLSQETGTPEVLGVPIHGEPAAITFGKPTGI